MRQIFAKIAGVSVLLLFILSVVPLAFADTDVTVDTDASDAVDGDVDGVNESESAGTDVDTDENDATDVDHPRADARGKVRSEMKERRNEIRDERRDIHDRVQEVRSDIRESRMEMREHFMKARDDLKVHHRELLDIKAQLKDCKNQESQECSDLHVKFNAGLKNHLTHLLEQTDNSFAQLKERIESSSELSADDKTQALADIASLEVKVDAQRVKVEALSENATKEEIKTMIKEMQGIVHEVRFEQRHLIALMVSSKVDVLVLKHGNFEQAMQVRIDELSAKGADVSRLVDIKAKFVAQGDKEEADAKVARDAWVQAESKDEKLDAWHDAHKAVRSDFEVSRQLLRDFMMAYKEIKSGLHASADSDTDAGSDTNASANTSAEASATN